MQGGSIPPPPQTLIFFYMAILNAHGTDIDLSGRLLFKIRDIKPLQEYYKDSPYRYHSVLSELLALEYVTQIPWAMCSDMMMAYKLEHVVEISELFNS